MNSRIHAMYDPNNPRFWYIQPSPKATVANTQRLTRPKPMAPVTIDFASEGRGFDSSGMGLILTSESHDNVGMQGHDQAVKSLRSVEIIQVKNGHDKTHLRHPGSRFIDDHCARRHC